MPTMANLNVGRVDLLRPKNQKPAMIALDQPKETRTRQSRLIGAGNHIEPATVVAVCGSLSPKNRANQMRPTLFN